MFSVLGAKMRLCDGISRRELLHVGGLGAFGLGLPFLMQARQARGIEVGSVLPALGLPRAKSCIVLFLMGGPSQHSTWDPKPNAPAEIRGEFAPISTVVPGMQFSELLPRTSLLADRFAVMRAVSSGDNAHSSSGYYMLTGQPHAPMNSENANPGFPNDSPNIGSIIRKLIAERGGLPASMRLPHQIFNSDGSIWPGQDAGFLGRSVEPWLLNCQPATPNFRIDELTLNPDISPQRLTTRRSLLDQINQRHHDVGQNERNGLYRRLNEQAFNVLNSANSRQAFELDRETPEMRDRYGRTQFGQSVLLGRRLIEAGVSLVQVNWFRGPDEPSDTPCWDSHAREAERLKTVLAPPTDQALAALVEDLEQRGRLDDTLIVCMAEFGRTPRINGAGGRDHWGHVYSVALAGGGIRGGVVHGASDTIGAYPASGRVQPQDLTATIFHCLGLDPLTEIHDTLGRPIPISRGSVIQQVLA